MPRNSQDELDLFHHLARAIVEYLIARPEIDLLLAVRRIEQAKLVVLPGAEPDPVGAFAAHDRQAIHGRVLVFVTDEEPHPRVSAFVETVDRRDHLIPGW